MLATACLEQNNCALALQYGWFIASYRLFVGVVMTLMRAISRTFVTLQLCLWCHIAVAVAGDDGPSELPPEAFTANTYIDSRGCVYVRAGLDDVVHWLPQVTKTRTPVCGRSPTFGDPVAQALGPDPALPVPAPTLQDVAVSKKKISVAPTSESLAPTDIKPLAGRKPTTTGKLENDEKPKIAEKPKSTSKTVRVPRHMPLGYATAWQDQSVEGCGTRCGSRSSVVALRFVQVATFAVKANANRTVAKLDTLGLPILIRESKIKGRVYCVVLSGPFERKTDLLAALKMMQAAGFKDAFARR